VRIYGLDGRTQSYRGISAEELRAACFQNGAAVLRGENGAVFTLLTVHRDDFQAYLAALDRFDAGAWPNAA
jgi:hypothetical protein